MIDVTMDNFETEVVQASLQTPVLVDFWAPWCGPCKSLGPVLEKLEVEYQGRFKLVKINSDDEQQLAGAFGIRSIPTCVLMVGGRPADGFMGALPEGQVKQFLDKHLPSQAELDAQQDMNQAETALAEGNTDEALTKLQEALAINPANHDARYDYVKLLITLGELEHAQTALAPALTQIPQPLRFVALGHWLEALQFATTDERATWTLEAFDERIAQNKRDFDMRLAKARLLMAAGEWVLAMDELLEIVMRDKNWENGLARRYMVSILELLTPPPAKDTTMTPGKTAGGIELMGKAALQEDPKAALVSSYRRKLSMALN